MLLAVLTVTWGGWWSVEALQDPLLSPELFYPFGPDEGDATVTPNDDESSETVYLTNAFNFFNTSNTMLYVSEKFSS